MNLKLIVAISVIAAMPVCAQAQKSSAAKVTKADAENVVKIISGDKAKTRTYCNIVDLSNQFEEAEQKNDTEKTDELSQQIDELVPELGSEYTALNEGLEDIDPNSKDSTDIVSTLAALDKLCAKPKSPSEP
jgi:DNA repair ATPase RecN